MPGRPLISNSGFYTENIFSFIEYYLKSFVQKVKCYIKDTYDFLRKLASFAPLPDVVILCAINIVSLYPNIMYDEKLIAIRKALDLRKDKRISTKLLSELAECVLKNNIFELN